MLRQSSLGGTVHWTVPFAAELRVEAHLLSPTYSTKVERSENTGCSDRASSAATETGLNVLFHKARTV